MSDTEAAGARPGSRSAYKAWSSPAAEPDEMGIGPIYAIPRAAEALGIQDGRHRTCRRPDDAFAVAGARCRDKPASPTASSTSTAKLGLDRPRPFPGMTGARCAGHALIEGRRHRGRRRGRRAVAIGGGMGLPACSRSCSGVQHPEDFVRRRAIGARLSSMMHPAGFGVGRVYRDLEVGERQASASAASPRRSSPPSSSISTYAFPAPAAAIVRRSLPNVAEKYELFPAGLEDAGTSDRLAVGIGAGGRVRHSRTVGKLPHSCSTAGDDAGVSKSN